MSLREFFAQILIAWSMVIMVYNDGILSLLFHIQQIFRAGKSVELIEGLGKVKG